MCVRQIIQSPTHCRCVGFFAKCTRALCSYLVSYTKIATLPYKSLKTIALSVILWYTGYMDKEGFCVLDLDITV